MKQTKYIIVFIGILLLQACGNTQQTSRQNANADVDVTQNTIKPGVQMTPLMEGKILFARCKACHTLNSGGKHLVGPNLYNVMGREAGTQDGFVYSRAMEASGVVWTEQTLSDYLENPLKYVSGGRMAFAGLRNLSDREKVILYLRSETDPTFTQTDAASPQ